MELKEKRKRRREGFLIVVLIPIIAFLIYLEIKSFSPNFKLGITNSVLFFILANVNIILLLLFTFLTLRNFVKLVAERKKGIIGSKIRTKLVLLFVSLSFLPTLVLFGVSIKFVFSAFNFWFNIGVEKAINQTLEIGHFYYKETSDELIHYSIFFKKHLVNARGGLVHEAPLKKLRENLEKYNLHLLQVYNDKNESLLKITRDPLKEELDFKNNLAEFLKTKSPLTLVKSLAYGDLVYSITPLTEKDHFLGFFILGKLVPLNLVEKLEVVRKSSDDYKQLAFFMGPLKMSLFIIFSIITLLVLFAATWVGFRLAKVITTPIQTLAMATQEVAKGNLDVKVEVKAADEVAMLVNSFNKMVSDLSRTSKKLREQNLEIERRHEYTKTILENIKTGVISTDASSYIITINPAAREILRLKDNNLVGKRFEALAQLFPEFKEIGSFFSIGEKLEKPQRQLKLEFKDRSLTLIVGATLLKDKNDHPLGSVFVFEDITQLERMQRMAAWREVAQRVAHEIKNPLTPIQLSAQRLQRRYLAQLKTEPIFAECTQMIIKQVEELQKTVNEFSNLARLPAVKFSPNNLDEVIEEALTIYRNAHPHIVFKFSKLNQMPIFLFDREQIKRSLLNLLDNAVASIIGQGIVEVAISYNPSRNIARIEVKDTGQGIPEGLKARLFEPYFSTKKTGAGLGLTIVHTIISDHQGHIQVKNNSTQGSIFVIELPVKT
jgi:two-component system nitrogen regulation sensor histidine kinase NtrY